MDNGFGGNFGAATCFVNEIGCAACYVMALFGCA
ncbi:MAG: hypothetical protein ACI8V2_005379, partial [Candidatus Latescibacterota bacterium]